MYMAENMEREVVSVHLLDIDIQNFARIRGVCRVVRRGIGFPHIPPVLRNELFHMVTRLRHRVMGTYVSIRYLTDSPHTGYFPQPGASEPKYQVSILPE